MQIVAGLSDISVSQRPPFFQFEPGAKWHGFEGYAADQYFVIRASCYSLHQVSMPKPASIALWRSGDDSGALSA